MDIMEYKGEDFKVLMKSDGWKIGFLRYSERFSDFKVLERHLETEEAFILLEGKATLYEDYEAYEMEKTKVYNIAKRTWHHIVVSKEATVMVIENENTCKKNTEYKMCYKD